jgi:hypothetical protein
MAKEIKVIPEADGKTCSWKELMERLYKPKIHLVQEEEEEEEH